MQRIMNECAKMLKVGKIGVMPTDTIYGLVGQALKKKTISAILLIFILTEEK